jgi:hypothetical protein
MQPYAVLAVAFFAIEYVYNQVEYIHLEGPADVPDWA